VPDPFFDYPDQEAPSQEIVFLPSWTERDWQALVQSAEVRRFRKGETLAKMGEADRSLMIVTSGSLEVLIPQGRRGKMASVATLGSGSVAGEQSFLDGLPRSADLVALEDGEALVLRPEAFEIFAARHPDLALSFLRDLARMLSTKLRRANEFIAQRLG
jgi:CRP/FNR family transcriptional regulator, cyclic AMP receptor protein